MGEEEKMREEEGVGRTMAIGFTLFRSNHWIFSWFVPNLVKETSATGLQKQDTDLSGLLNSDPR